MDGLHPYVRYLTYALRLGAKRLRRYYDEGRDEDLLRGQDMWDRMEEWLRALGFEGCIWGKTGCPAWVVMTCRACAGRRPSSD